MTTLKMSFPFFILKNSFSPAKIGVSLAHCYYFMFDFLVAYVVGHFEVNRLFLKKIPFYRFLDCFVSNIGMMQDAKRTQGC